ncbi:MAG TPA: tetratricopeptide repeat protein [Candidatus Kapabacteria bacterium]|nr:tetratricopeptide repeat protein [Candidatus Kapabacteria bacterium]
MERLTYEAEDEFEFQDEKKRAEPRVFIPNYTITVADDNAIGPPPFMTEFIVTKQKRQPVNVKLDSILIKGSKIIAYKAKSQYVQGAIWLMAKAFFYQEDWLNSQIKCSELIDKYPDGDFSPDAHLLYSKNLLVQRKFEAGELMLSRTMDIAWYKQRWDILSEALRIKAELALYQDDYEKALRPYKQAIAQSDDSQLKAKWQLDMAALLFRIGKFEMAQKEFRKVHNYSPDYVQRFEAYLYEASSYARLHKYEQANQILEALYTDGKFEEWRSFTYTQQLNVVRIQSLDTNYVPPVDDEGKPIIANIDNMEKLGDSLYANSSPIMSYYYEKGVDYYYQNDYRKARQQFAKSRQKRTPAYATSMRMFELLNNWDIGRNKVDKYIKTGVDSVRTLPDSLRLDIADNLYSIGRIQEELGNKDSVVHYYKLASEISPIDSVKSVQYLHNYARVIEQIDPMKSDSLLDVIVAHHPLSEYGKDAQSKLGYTQNFVIDTAADVFHSAYNLMKFSDYEFARKQFINVFTNYPQSRFAPKSLYTLGWMFEQKQQKYDSALYYYDILIKKYPESEYAKDINLAVLYKNIVESGQEVPDSLKTKDVVIIPAKMPEPFVPNKKIKLPPKKKSDMESLLDAPSNIFNKAKDLFNNPEELIKQLELPDSPIKKIDELMNPSDSTSTKDSTNIQRKVEEPPKK